MIRFLPIIIALILLGGGFAYTRLSYPSKTAQSPVQKGESLNIPVKNNEASPAASVTLEQRVQSLETNMLTLAKEIKSSNNSGSAGTTNNSSLAALEIRIEALEKDVANLKQSASTTQTTSKKSPLYIPLNWTGSATGTDWTSVTTQQISIDPADYPGYTSMQFEAALKVFQGNGQAYARVYNNTNYTAVLGSEVSTTSEDYTWVSSGNFTLGSGKKTYILQLKTLTGYEAAVQNARLKVNF